MLQQIPQKKFLDVYPDGPPKSEFVLIVNGGLMSISHWGLIDLGRFGVAYMPDGVYWQEDGEVFEVKPYVG